MYRGSLGIDNRRCFEREEVAGMSRLAQWRRERALAEVVFCDGCGCACDGRSRSDAVRERTWERLGIAPVPLRVA